MVRLQAEPESNAVDVEVQQAYRREVFRWAAERTRSEFAVDTWQAFWMTTVERKPATTVAAELGKSIGAVYTARSRVMQRLRAVVCAYQDAETDDRLSEIDWERDQ